ncbi:hypothetical protein BDF14DRAFT_1766693 [Spinellus fusiger]|nr:hypothetical protein BDF14DRAFT_1766693 [Spinellus fusiger]
MSSFEFDTLSYTLLTSIITAAALASLKNSKTPDVHPLLLNTQSDVSRLRHAGESAIYRSRMYPNGSPLLSTFDRLVCTLCDLYETGGLSKHGSSAFIGKQLQTGELEWHTYDMIRNRSKLVQAALRTWAGLVPLSGNESSFVGVYASNSPETVTVELACHCNGLVTVPMSSQSTSTHISHVLSSTSLRVLMVDPYYVERVLSLVNGTSLKYIVVLGAVTNENRVAAQALGIEVITLNELETKGKSTTVKPVSPGSLDIATVLFSSAPGQDTKPGAVLTHMNLLSNVASYLAVLPPQRKFTAQDRLMHHLPIDNALGHTLFSTFCYIGGSIVFGSEASPEKNITALLSAVAKAEPTILASDSIFLQQAKATILSQYGDAFLFHRGLAKKMLYLDEGRLVKDSKYDTFVFRNIQRTLLGGKVRLVFVDNDNDAEPIAPFLRAVLNAQVLKTLNHPETSGTVTASMLYDYKADTKVCGAPLPCNEVKLVDLLEEGYTANDQPNPRGEIWVRGNNVFGSYWNDPVATNKVIDADGWYMTGIIGEIMPHGTFKILGHK